MEAAGGALVVAGLAPAVDCRRDGSVAFFRTVFILNRTFPNLFFSFSWGAEAPPCAGELMFEKGLVLLSSLSML